MSLGICGGNVVFLSRIRWVGCKSDALGLMAYCRASFSLVNIMMVLQPQRRVFLQAMFEKLLRLV